MTSTRTKRSTETEDKAAKEKDAEEKETPAIVQTANAVAVEHKTLSQPYHHHDCRATRDLGSIPSLRPSRMFW